MTKKTKTAHSVSANKPLLPLVSICTPTFNRRPFIPIMFECFRNQTYPKSRMEWVIIDDGTDKIGDLVDAANIPQIKYFTVDKKMSLGAKRNMMHDKSRGSILVYMDDDDYYPPERVSHAVETLMRNPQALCAGASEIYLYFKNTNIKNANKSDLKHSMYQFGPYGPNHATAATFAFRRELLNMTRYESNTSIAEERAFLKEYTIPFAQLDPLKTILVFSHEHNSFDKRNLLENPNPNFTKLSDKTVDMFIKFPHEARIKKFFLEDIDELLRSYAPGEPRMKPDVLKQIQEIKEKREKQAREMAEKAGASNQGGPQIMMQQPGGKSVAVGINDAVGIINQQQNQIKQMLERIKELESSRDKETTKKIDLPKSVIDAVNPVVYIEKINGLEKKIATLETQKRDLQTEIKFLNIRIAEFTAQNGCAESRSNLPPSPPYNGISTGMKRKESSIFNHVSKSEPEVIISLHAT